MTLPLDDERTLTAIGILADVLDRFSGTTALECTLVSKALRQVQATRSQVGMDFASRAFSTLDADVRRRIADEAEEVAQDAVAPRAPRLRAARSADDAPAKAKPQPRQSTSFLDALNTGSRGKGATPRSKK